MRVSICISRGGKFTFSNASTAGQNNNATLSTELRGHSPPSTVPGINRTVDKRHFSAAIAARLSRSHLSLRVYRSANWGLFSPLFLGPLSLFRLNLLVKRRASASVLNPPNGPRNRTWVNCTVSLSFLFYNFYLLAAFLSAFVPGSMSCYCLHFVLTLTIP